jgi:RNA polymerase-associated protein
VLTLYDAARCPYCARVRIVLAEKDVEHGVAEVDLDDRPAWIFAKNPAGKVPVIEDDDGLVLPESLVIMEYLEHRFPEPALWPDDPAERALARFAVHRFDALGDAYYALRRGEERARAWLDRQLAELDRTLAGQPYLTGRAYGLADVAYVPWILRARSRLGVDLDPYAALTAWVERLSERPAVAAELELASAT